MNNRFLDACFSIRLVLLVALVSLTSWLYLPARTTLRITLEDGPIENATVLFYYLAMIVLWLFRPRALSRRSALAIHIILMALAARELDLHKALTGTSMLKLRFWEGMTPAPQWIEAFGLLLALFAVIAALIWRHWKEFRAALRRRDAWAVTLATFVATMVIAKLADRSLGVLRERFSFESADWLAALMQSIEEPFEMMLPVLIAIAVLQGLSKETLVSRRWALAR